MIENKFKKFRGKKKHKNLTNQDDFLNFRIRKDHDRKLILGLVAEKM